MVDVEVIDETVPLLDKITSSRDEFLKTTFTRVGVKESE